MKKLIISLYIKNILSLTYALLAVNQVGSTARRVTVPAGIKRGKIAPKELLSSKFSFLYK